MAISVKDQNHGSALIQIAEWPTFKAINSFEPTKGQKSNAAFIVNTDTGIYFKYGTTPKKPFTEYSFTFNKSNFAELDALHARFKDRSYIALVCVKAGEVCLLSVADLYEKRAERERDRGSTEEQYQVLVAVSPRKSFRVYMNASGVRKKSLTKTIVNRNEFPRVLFR